MLKKLQHVSEDNKELNGVVVTEKNEVSYNNQIYYHSNTPTYVIQFYCSYLITFFD